MKQQHIYTSSILGILKHSFGTLFIGGIFIWLNLFTLNGWLKIESWSILVAIDIVSLGLIIPGIMIHFNYSKYSNGLSLVIEYKKLKYIDNTGKEIQCINNQDVVSIEYFETIPSGGRALWGSYSFFVLKSKQGDEFVINSYILELTDFWTDGLTRLISNKSFTRKSQFIPIIRRNN
jgi:hypothetical protein